jgi:hypothetical protein
MTRMRNGMTILILAIPWLAWSCDCGQHGPGTPVPDGTDDGVPDMAADGTPDGAPDAAGDPLEDIVSDTVDEDALPPPGGGPFQTESAGGGLISSENYAIELFVAPVRPVGTVSNDNYTIQLGPAGMRRP